MQKNGVEKIMDKNGENFIFHVVAHGESGRPSARGAATYIFLLVAKLMAKQTYIFLNCFF